MFLTNNYKTINNLMIYSKGGLIFKIIPKPKDKIKPYSELSDPEWFIIDLQDIYNDILKSKNNNENKLIDYTVKPYGNIGRKIYLETDNNGKVIIYNWKGH